MKNKIPPMRNPVIKDKGNIKLVSSKNIDMDIVDYLKHNFPSELNLLDKWILVPNYKYLTEMSRLIDFIIDTYLIDKNITLYRGFSPGTIQDTLGLKTNGVFNTIKNQPRHRFKEIIKNPLSFTTDFDIASSFGSVVVKTVSKIYNDVLPITDEICYIINQKRNLKIDTAMESQFEHILMPSEKILNLEIIMNKDYKATISRPPAADW